MAERYDVVIIGGGSGGYVAAIRAAQLGLRTAVVERDKVGGTCLHRGCIPTKALLQTAALLDSINHGERLGVTTDGVQLNFSAALDNKQRVVDTLFRGVQGLLKKNTVTSISGVARVDGPGKVVIEGEGIGGVEASTIILATGSRPKAIAGVTIDGEHVMSSDEALHLDHVPRRAIVLGGGAVGVEFASLWRSMGAEVTVVEMAERLTPLEDHEIGAELRKQFERRGIQCLVGARLDPSSLERINGGIAVMVRLDGAEQRLESEVLLVAVGRSANTEDLGLETTEVTLDRGTVVVDGHMQTDEPGIMAVGDMVGGFWLAHKAMHEGIVAAEVAAGLEPEPIQPSLVTRTTYCTPQIGSFGLSEEEARAAGHDVQVGRMPFAGNARAVVWGETGGFCKVVADATTKNVLGVHIIGHEVTELIAGPALGALLEVTPYELSRAIAPHPTLSEVLGEAALAVSGEAIHI